MSMIVSPAEFHISIRVANLEESTVFHTRFSDAEPKARTSCFSNFVQMCASDPLRMMLVVAAVMVAPFWFIFANTGFSKWLNLLILTPLVSVNDLYFLALAKWSGLGNGNIQGQLPDGY